MSEDLKEIIPASLGLHLWRKKTLIAVGIFLAAAILVVGGSWAYGFVYRDSVYPGVYLGKHHMGGLTKAQAEEFIENFNNRIAKEGVAVQFDARGKVQNSVLPAVSAEDSSVEMIHIDSGSTVNMLVQIGRTGNIARRLFAPVWLQLFENHDARAVTIVEERFISSMESYFSAFADPARNANILVTSISPLQSVVEPEKTGTIFDYNAARQMLSEQLAQLVLPSVQMVKKDFTPDVFAADVQPLFVKLPEILSYGDLSLNYTDPQTGRHKEWKIGADIYSRWLEIRREQGELIFALKKEGVLTYLETLRPFINMPAKDAKFVMENDRVKEFQANQSGLILNEEKTYADLDVVFKDRNYHPAEPVKTVTVSVDIVEPNVAMSNVNNLGIMEIVGVGYSTFKDSHTNRIKNIANAVKRLNGILIKPDEEFSANKYAGPYTAENGFLPEMVIKGNRIIPEIGGGMCQIGTTLFRAAMNSGMPITERRNHSLVVSYYADPVNGNPGTDATLYEPNVDFKFKNDTGGYLLLQTSIDYVKQELVFTFWGKSDGRKGSYTHPVVNKWIPAGEPQEIVVPDLKPGERKCQNAFRGAMTSFTYTIIKPSGEKVDQVFDSYYRPLSQICMVGAAVSTSTVDANVPVEVGQ